MASISSFAKGFLDLLGLNTLGENPRELANQVQAVVDIGEQYQAGKTIYETVSIADLQNGFNACITVPAGEVWCIKQAHAGMVTAAGEAALFNLGVRIEGNTYALGEMINLGASTAGISLLGIVNVWIPAGAIIGVQCQTNTGVVTGTLTAITTRLKA